MNIEDFLANPDSPCIRLRVGPGEDGVVEIDQLHFDAHKDEFLDWCLGLPAVEGLNWRMLKTHTNGNGLMAKVLVAMGDLAGAWNMHPPRENWHGPWGRESPRILVVTETKSRIPKPSRGDLEADAEPCVCCKRTMGPADSYQHDLYRSQKESKLCIECAAMDCDEEEDNCHVFPEKKAQVQRTQQPKNEVGLGDIPRAPPSGLETYLKQFE